MILGIDLGTTNTVVATLDGTGRPVPLPNDLGELITPSVVHFESATAVLVGTAARAVARLDPDNTVELIKRRMGTECDLLFHGTHHTPESISALILRGAIGDRGPVRAVVTVPAYFGIREREATYQAARLAGIEVLELLSEPVAAALHHGVVQAPGRGAVLVYDLGGGTFDTTVLRVGEGGVKVVATDGDSALGGADWDDRIAEHLVESFARTTDEVDPYEDEVFLRDAHVLAEEAKRALSDVASRRVVLRCGAASAAVILDRPTLESLGSDLVDRTLGIVRRALTAAATKGVHHVDHVVLVGGSTRMPAIGTAVEARLGVRPRQADPDFAVACGAAIRAHQLADEASRASLRKAGGALAALADKPTSSVVPRSFGVLVEDSYDPSGTRRSVVHTVHRNDPLPARATAFFSTVLDGQDRVRVQVFEQAGEVPSEEVEHNRRVLDGELSGLPPLPAGSRIEVVLEVDAGGLLSVTAREPVGGATLRLQGYVDGVLDADGSRRAASSLAGLSVRQ
ncbi:Hsp70 family protein [Actinosynnema sp. NPDC059797]